MFRKIIAFFIIINLVTVPAANGFARAKCTVRDVGKEITDEVKASRAPSTAALLSFFIPGAGFVYLGKWDYAAVALASDLGLLVLSLLYGNAAEGEVNVPSIFYSQRQYMEVFVAYQLARKKYNNVGYKIPYDEKSPLELMMSPFNPKVISKPTVFLPMLVAAGLTIIEVSSNKDRGSPLSDATKIKIVGRERDVVTGTAIYEGLWGMISMGAGVGEEFLFRGVLQSEITNHTNPITGLLCTSAIFGILHLANPGQSENYWYPVFATAAGIYFGWLYMKNDYQLSESIAAHFWWDFVVGTVGFIMDPEHNSLGAGVSFSF